MLFLAFKLCQGPGREPEGTGTGVRGTVEGGGEGTCAVPSSGEICGRERGIARGEREKRYPKEFLQLAEIISSKGNGLCVSLVNCT